MGLLVGEGLKIATRPIRRPLASAWNKIKPYKPTYQEKIQKIQNNPKYWGQREFYSPQNSITSL
jgi:hypothetical protein